MVNILAREANISWHTTDDRNFRFCKLLFLGPSATQPVKCEVDWMNGCWDVEMVVQKDRYSLALY